MVRSTLSVFSDFQLGRVGRICSGPRAPDFLNYASHFQHNLRSFSGVEVGFKKSFLYKNQVMFKDLSDQRTVSGRFLAPEKICPEGGHMKTRPGSIFSDFHFDYMKTSGRHPASIFLGEAPQRLHGAKHSPPF